MTASVCRARAFVATPEVLKSELMAPELIAAELVAPELMTSSGGWVRRAVSGV